MIRRRIILYTTVWGFWHTDVFLRLNLASLLCPNNLPAFANMHSLSFVISTTDRDRARIMESPRFKQLVDILPVQFERIPDEQIRDPIATQQYYWSQAIEETKRLGAFLFFLPPDVVWSNASLLNIARAMANGRRIIYVPWGMRVVSETFEKAVGDFLGARDPTAGIESRDLVRLTIQYLHPLVASYTRRSSMFPHHPEMLIETVRGQGLLLRILASIPTVYEPNSVALNHNKLVIERLPDHDVYIPEDSDEVFVASLAPFGKDAHFFDRPRRAHPVTIGRWWLGYPSGLNDVLTRTNYRVHCDPLEPANWRMAQHALDYFLRRAVIAREGLEVWNSVRKRSDCTIAVEALAGSLFTGTLNKTVRGYGGRVVFFPTDVAMSNTFGAMLNSLTSAGNRKEFVGILRRHMARLTPAAVGILSGGSGAVLMQTDGGDNVEMKREVTGELFVDDHRIAEKPISAGDHVALITPFARLPLPFGTGKANSSRATVAQPQLP